MKKFLLFAGADYYANGGWFDFRGSFETVEEAEAAVAAAEAVPRPAWRDSEYEWWHVVDGQTGEWCAGSDEDKVGRQSRPWPDADGKVEAPADPLTDSEIQAVVDLQAPSSPFTDR